MSQRGSNIYIYNAELEDEIEIDETMVYKQKKDYPFACQWQI
jgi:hypothetical protein